MRSFRVELFLFIIAIISVNSNAKAQDSTGLITIANAVLKKTEPQNVVYNRTMLIKGEEGTNFNTGKISHVKLEAGTIYTITLLVDVEDEGELTLLCSYNQGDAETQTPTKLSDNIVLTNSITVSAYGAVTLDIKKTKSFLVMVGGRKLPEEGLYYKLIVTKL